MRFSHRRHIARHAYGAMLIELLVSIGIASILLLALCANIAEYMRLTTTIEGQEIAAYLAEEVVERVHSIPFDSTVLDVGKNYVLAVNGDSDITTAPLNCYALQRPLLFDPANYQYSDAYAEGKYHRSNAKVSMTIESGPINPSTGAIVDGTKTLRVNVIWRDSNAPKNFELKAILYRHGFQQYGS